MRFLCTVLLLLLIGQNAPKLEAGLPPPPPEISAPAPVVSPPPPAPDAPLPPDTSSTQSPNTSPSTRDIPEEGGLITVPVTPTTPVAEEVYLPVIGRVRWKSMGLPLFTLAVGLIDGFNPCAMWVLLFLLSLLVNLRNRWKILAVAGTFVVISGAAYYAFMAAWLSIFQFVGLLRPAQIILGIVGIIVGTIHVKDFFAFKKGISLSIPDSVKPGVMDRMRKIVMAESLFGAILGASILAVLVNIVELLCTAGLPAMYTGILSAQSIPPWQHYAYLLLYIIAYMFDDTLMVALVVVTLGKHKLQERGGRYLKLLSGVVILGIGGLMLFKPEWLV